MFLFRSNSYSDQSFVRGETGTRLTSCFTIFRKAIYDYQGSEREKFIGIVEIDESYFGPRRIPGNMSKKGRGTHKSSQSLESLNELDESTRKSFQTAVSERYERSLRVRSM